jgi:hypothetical protein
MPARVEHFIFVPNGYVHVYERYGWIVTPILNDTHHCFQGTAMKPGHCCKYDEEGEPIRPKLEAAA